MNEPSESANVISLKAARSRFRPGACQHTNLSIDEDLAEASCDDCGAKLNPIGVLTRFANEQTRWAQKADAARALLAKIDERIRCTCQHCGKMTRIRP